MKNKPLLLPGALTLALLSWGSVHADEAEDQSGAEEDESLGPPEHLKMLVVRENEDGSLSVGHSSSADDAVEFINSDESDTEEQESE